MKQKVIIMLMLCQIQTLSLFAQTEHYSMLEGNPEWVYHFMPPSESTYNSIAYALCSYPNEMYMRLYANSDTIHYQSHVYNIIYFEAYDASGQLIDGGKYFLFLRKNPSPYMAMRESGGKVFATGAVSGSRFTKQVLNDRSTYDPNEVMIFDNDIHKGDTVYECTYYDYSLNPDLGKYTVVPIIGDTLIQVADGSMRRMLTYECKNYSKQLQYMVEGIGFINPDNMPLYAMLETHDFGMYDNNRHFCNLIMFRQNDKVVYISPRAKDDASYEEKAMSFAPMPFYPDITPESVADGTYTLPAAVDGIADNKTSKGKQIYNLQGQKTDGLQRGINIVGGKKVIVK